MCFPESRFAEELVEPMVLIDIPCRANPDPSQTRSRQFLSETDIEKYFNQYGNCEHSSRFISICQRTSWSPLQTTLTCLKSIASNHGIGPGLFDIPSYFNQKELEETFCLPYSSQRDGTCIELSYTMKYPEYKENDGKWVIRQSGIFQRYDTESGNNFLMLFSPNPDSKVHRAAVSYLRDNIPRSEPLWLHKILFEAHAHSWRGYIAMEESKLLPMAKKILTTFRNEPLGFDYEPLSKLSTLENNFARVTALLATSIDVLDELLALAQECENHNASLLPSTRTFKNCRNQCIAYSRTTTYLQRRTQKATQVMTESLSFQDQLLAKHQNDSMLQLNKTAVFMTTLTLVYLPSSFIATCFGMNFFDMSTSHNHIVTNSSIWIFFVLSFALSAATLLSFYRRLNRSDPNSHDTRKPVYVGISRSWRRICRVFAKTKELDIELQSTAV